MKQLLENWLKLITTVISVTLNEYLFIYLFIHFEPIEQRFMKIEDHLKSLRPILDAVLCRGVPELFYLARLSLMYKNFL